MPLNNMKTWADGELVTAASMNAEIRDPINSLTPGHQIFATTVARDAALPSPTAGTMVYVTALNRLQTYIGGAWVDTRTVTPATRAIRTASYTPGSGVAVTWTSVASPGFNTDGMWSAGAGSRLTIQTPGIYAVSAVIQDSVSVATSTYQELYLRVNAAANYVSYTANFASVTAQALHLSTAGIWNFSAGDYVEAVYGYNNGTHSILPNNSYLAAAWLGRAS